VPLVILSMVFGNQVPEIPIGEIVGNGGVMLPVQNARSGNPGETGSLTSMYKVAFVAHSFAAGVKS